MLKRREEEKVIIFRKIEKEKKRKREVIEIISDFFKHPLIGNRNGAKTASKYK